MILVGTDRLCSGSNPLTTIKSGEVDIGAFRVYTENERSDRGYEFRQQMKLCSQLNDPNVGDSRKEADYGNHRETYYSLEVKKADDHSTLQQLIVEDSSSEESIKNNVENMRESARIIKASAGLCCLGQSTNERKMKGEIAESLLSRHS